jgi:YggT family protein
MIIYIIVNIISVTLSLFELCMLARAILSWIPGARDRRTYYFFYKITEPVLRPVRDVIMRYEWARRCPIDLSFLAVLILITIAQRLVYLLYYLV